MKLTEYKIEKGLIEFKGNEKVLSFGVKDNDVYFWCATKEGETILPPQKYTVLENGDEVPEELIHIATLVEGVQPKHLFFEKPPEITDKKLAKVFTKDGVETVEDKEETVK